MLKDLDKSKLPIEIGGMKMYLRYNLTARRYLEEYYPDGGIFNKSETDWGIDDVLHLLRAGLIDCFFERNKEAIEKRDFASVYPSLAELGQMLDEDGAADLAVKIMYALIDSLPDPVIGAEVKKKTPQRRTNSKR